MKSFAGWTVLVVTLIGARIEAGTVQTVDGKTLQGTLRLQAPDTIAVSSGTGIVRVAFNNLLRADFAQPTNAPTVHSSHGRMPNARTDEHKGALPSSWQSSDIGKVQKPGASTHARGSFSIESHPLVKKAKGDALHFVYQPWEGDCEIVARVASITPRDERNKQARAGVMMRKSLEADAPNVSMSISGGLGSFFKRVSRKGTKVIDDKRADLKPPYWIKLNRENGIITGFHSTDGRNWQLAASSATDLPERILIGLAVSSERRSSALAELDHVTVRSPVPGANYTPRIVLRDGTVIADRFASMDSSALILSPGKEGRRIPLSDVARLLFQPLFVANSLTPGRAGLLLNNGDFVDGDFRGIENGRAKVSSVLLGQRTYDLHPKVVAVLIRDVSERPAAFEIAARDGSVWRPKTIKIESETLRLEEPLAGRWSIPAEDLVEIKRSTGKL